MYSWGSDTGAWKRPDAYRYDSARRGYLDDLAAKSAAKGGRSYARGTKPDSKLVATHGKVITTDSANPIVIATDVTGSMQHWPAEIFDRLPLLYQTLSQYQPDTEISFAAIGDATCDHYPLQVNNFGQGVTLEDHLKAIYPEGGGGGGAQESYELFGYFMLNCAEMPRAKSPFLIIFGDEGFYERVDPAQVDHFIGFPLQTPMDSDEMWKQLMQKFNVFLLHKPYYDGGAEDDAIVKQWTKALGKQRIIPLYESERAVDVAIGLIAKHWGKFDDFEGSMYARHDPSEVTGVYRSLRMVDIDGSGRSVIKGIPGPESVPLLGPGDDT